MCGDPECPSCGATQGTLRPPRRRDSRAWAIYLTDRHGRHVLLSDGAYTAIENAQTAQRRADIKLYGVALHTPKLFPRKRDASIYATTYCGYMQNSIVSVARWEDKR